MKKKIKCLERISSQLAHSAVRSCFLASVAHSLTLTLTHAHRSHSVWEPPECAFLFRCRCLCVGVSRFDCPSVCPSVSVTRSRSASLSLRVHPDRVEPSIGTAQASSCLNTAVCVALFEDFFISFKNTIYLPVPRTTDCFYPT